MRKSSEITKKHFSYNDENRSIVIKTSKIFNTVYFPLILLDSFDDVEIAKFVLFSAYQSIMHYHNGKNSEKFYLKISNLKLFA